MALFIVSIAQGDIRWWSLVMAIVFLGGAVNFWYLLRRYLNDADHGPA